MVPVDYFLFISICRVFSGRQSISAHDVQFVNKHWYGNFLNYALLSWISMNKLQWGVLRYTDLASVLYYFLMVDFLFFMVHYGCHLGLYERIHHVHHLCKPLVTFCTRSSHAIDAALENLVFVLPLLFHNFNGFVAYICLITNAFWVAYLHTNVTNATNTKGVVILPKHHCIHHRHGKNSYNYALYFTFWDRMFGTFKPDY